MEIIRRPILGWSLIILAQITKRELENNTYNKILGTGMSKYLYCTQKIKLEKREAEEKGMSREYNRKRGWRKAMANFS